MTVTKTVKCTELKVGDVVHFYGARFEIYETELHDAATCGSKYGDVMSARGKWLDGECVRGYFGPKKGWTFQGNEMATHVVEVAE